MANTTSAANKTSGNNKKGGFKWGKFIVFFIVFLLIRNGFGSKNRSDSYIGNSYSGSSYTSSSYSNNSCSDNRIYETSANNYYTEEYRSNSSNNLVGIWSNEEGIIAIYDTGYAEVKLGYESADYSWTASDTMLTMVPFNRLQYEPVTMYYEISGDTAIFTMDGTSAVMYR
ncbi:hypothetical protein [Fusibacillus kribbianus]|uniref:DUF5640 domain-containing protein n=1 Tax=Fusibacillus kribbianus TaxID=3044208 RepID=A0AAP4BAC8_9FIRM|nr:hypothetical protein [Ruminococcus sp. YH-rum2234]MDI9241188.1 hypothetical protein [Ruminococcus sp. YH-rum2234]